MPDSIDHLLDGESSVAGGLDELDSGVYEPALNGPEPALVPTLSDRSSSSGASMTEASPGPSNRLSGPRSLPWRAHILSRSLWYLIVSESLVLLSEE